MKYEMLYLIDSSVAEEARDALVAKFEDIVKNLGGTVVSMTFEANGDSVKELDRVAGITDGVIRRMITKAQA